MGLVSVKFLRNNAPYFAQESAGFDAKAAAQLVGDGVAIYNEPPPGLNPDGSRVEATPAPKKAPAKKKAPTKKK